MLRLIPIPASAASRGVEHRIMTGCRAPEAFAIALDDLSLTCGGKLLQSFFHLARSPALECAPQFFFTHRMAPNYGQYGFCHTLVSREVECASGRLDHLGSDA